MPRGVQDQLPYALVFLLLWSLLFDQSLKFIAGTPQVDGGISNTTTERDVEGEYIHPFNGSLTLYLKPYARIKSDFNPVSPGFLIPVYARGRAPWIIGYQVSAWIGVSDPYQVTTDFIINVTESPHFINATMVGLYYLTNVKDARMEEGRVGNDTVLVVEGPAIFSRDPSAEPKPFAEFYSQYPITTCADQHLMRLVKIIGVRPLKIRFEKSGPYGSNRFDVDAMEPHQGKYYLIKLGSVEYEGNYQWKILSVTDGINQTTTYPNPTDETPILEVFAKGRPTAGFYTGIAFMGEKQNVTLNVRLYGTPPFSLKLAFPNKDGEGQQELNFENVTKEFSITTDVAGIYRILSVKDAFCSGRVIEHHACKVVVVPPPTLKLDVLPPSSQCVGSVVIMMNLEMTGKGPWSVTFEESVRDESQNLVNIRNQSLFLTSQIYSHQILPSQAGIVKYRFLLLSDTVYSGIELKGIEYQTHIYQLPTVSIFNSLNSVCLFTETAISALWFGRFPIVLDYEIVDPQGKISELTHVSNSPHDNLSLVLNQQGKFTLRLLLLTDSNQCKSAISKDLLINSYKPLAKPICGEGNSIKIRKGDSFKVAIANGVPPFYIKYTINNAQEKTIIEDAASIALIPIESNGIISIKSMRDSNCEGQIQESSECNVIIADEPSISITWILNPQGCSKDEISVATMNFTGEQPWTLVYEESKFDSTATPIRREIEVSQQLNYEFRPQIPYPGTFKYQILEISDSRYSKISLKHLDLNTKLISLPRPSVSWSDNKERRICTGMSVELPIKFTGKAPFQIDYFLTTPTGSKLDRFLSSESDEMSIKIENLEEVGNYEIIINSVEDLTGCKTFVNINRLIVVGSEPKLITTRPYDRCEKETLNFGISDSEGPWELSYSLANKTYHEKIKDTKFSIFAKNPGNLRFISLANKFCVTHPNVNYIIHALPTGRVMSGEKIKASVQTESIDLVIELFGEPPFNVTIQRTLLYEDVSEQYEVKNIEEKMYVLKAKEEGEYYITYVSDRFCQSFKDPNL